MNALHCQTRYHHSAERTLYVKDFASRSVSVARHRGFVPVSHSLPKFKQCPGNAISLYVDFDDTISEGLTVPLQLKAVIEGAIKNIGDQAKAQAFAKERAALIQAGSIEYEQEGAELYETILKEHATGQFDRQVIDEVMRKCGAFDEKWVKQVISDKVLRGTSSESFLALAPHTSLKQNVLSVLNSFQEADVPLHILSVNWSADWIRTVVNKSTHASSNGSASPSAKIQVFSNEIVYENGISTGNCTRVMWSGQEKASLLQQLLETSRSTSGDSLSVFIGDSYYDIQPLLMVDVGIIMGKNENLFRFLECFGIKTQPLNGILTEYSDKHTTAPVLYTTDSWTEISEVFLDVQQRESLVSFKK